MVREKQIKEAIELLERRKKEVTNEVMNKRNYRTSVENLVIESISTQEKIQKKIDRLHRELRKERTV